MKRIILLSVLLLAASQMTSAEVPQTTSYQGVLRESDWELVEDGIYSLTFRLYAYETGDSLLWTETQTVDVNRGIFNVILGGVNPLDLDFDQTYWLGVQIGNDPELTPYVELTASPYALRSRVADSLSGAGPPDGDWVISGNDMYSALPGNVGIGTPTPTTKLEVDGNVRAYRFEDRDDPAYYVDPANSFRAGVFEGRVGVRGPSYWSTQYGYGPDLHVNTGQESASVWIGGNLSTAGADFAIRILGV